VDVERVLIVKAGTTIPSVAARRKDFESWIITAMGLAERQVTVARVREGEPLPPARDFAAAVVTGSSAMVTDREPWSERTAEWLVSAIEQGTPVLGICYGHQLLAHALGGRVDNNPLGRQIGTLDVTLHDAAEHDPLFSGFPNTLHLPVSHRQVVTQLPAGAALLARSERDPHHAFAFGDHAWGVQFHPEFDADIVRGYIDARRDLLAAEGLDPDQLLRNATDTEHGTLLLRRFAQLVRRSAG
jgi:GMP synthase (glutamine-hydrolysing)